MLTIRKQRTGTEAAAPAAAAPLGLEPEAAAPVPGRPAGAYTAAAILGIVATLCVTAVLVLQAMEFFFYSAPPSVWLAK